MGCCTPHLILIQHFVLLSSVIVMQAGVTCTSFCFNTHRDRNGAPSIPGSRAYAHAHASVDTLV